MEIQARAGPDAHLMGGRGERSRSGALAVSGIPGGAGFSQFLVEPPCGSKLDSVRDVDFQYAAPRPLVSLQLVVEIGQDPL